MKTKKSRVSNLHSSFTSGIVVEAVYLCELVLKYVARKP